MRRQLASKFVLSLLIAAGSVRVSCADDDAPKVIPAAEAKSHIDESCVIELTVRATKNAVGRMVYFLDSEEDFKDVKNFAVVISYDHAGKFKEAGVDDPSEYYRGKTIRVSGKVVSEDGQTRIRVEEPKQIKLVEKSN